MSPTGVRLLFYTHYNCPMQNQWDNIVGHEWATQLMASAIENDRLGHAYLITGPRQVGRSTLARTFAQAINCESPAAEYRPCGQCRSCTLINSDRHPDVRLVEPEVSSRGKLTLKIESIRELLHDLSLASYEAKYKVIILKDFEAATAGAANAFLKTLEEPPARVILILTAKDADTLLPTIASRCRTIGLRPLPPELIEQSLISRWHVDEDDAHLISRLADGRLGWAVQAGESKTMLALREQHLDLLYAALDGNRITRFAVADKMAKKSETIPDIIKSWLSWWRDAVLLGQQAAGHHAFELAISNIDQRRRLDQMSRKAAPKQLYACFEQTNQALWQLEHNANTRLVLENLFLTYPL